MLSVENYKNVHNVYMAMVLCGSNLPMHKTLRQKNMLISIAKDC